MKDLGIQVRVLDAARDLVRRAPASALAPGARELVTLFGNNGAFDPATATAADALFADLLELDADRDGVISLAEAPYARELSELYAALAENDRDGDLSLADEVLEQVPGLAKPSGPALVVPFGAGIDRRLTVLTLWSSRGARYAFEQSRKIIERVRPDVVLIHTDPVALANGGGAALTADIRKAYPWLRVGWAWYGDSYGPDPSAIWCRCARAGEACGVETLQPNCESAWKLARRGSHAQRSAFARRGMNAVREGAPTRHISFTSFDGWVNVPWKGGRWGGHETMPVEGFLGEGSPCDGEAGQVYTAASAGELGASYEAAVDRFARHEKSRAAAVKKGLIAPRVEAMTYLQLHSARTSNICYLASRRRVSIGWAANSRIDDAGVEGFAAASALARMIDENSGESMTVEQFQARYGLEVDGRMGDRSLAQLAQVA